MHRTIKGFDGIRGLAVIAVVLTHLGFYTTLTELNLLPQSFVPMINGSTGVHAFFVLSGFLITTLLINEFNANGTISIKNFIVRRTFRIFPLYILFLIVITLLHVFGQNVTTWKSLTYAYVYAYNFVPTWLYSNVLGHTWSLAVEEHFYIVWPSVFMMLFSKHRFALIGLIVTFIASVPVIQFFLINSGIATGYFVERWSFISGSSIAIGCLVAILIGSEQTARQTRRFAQHPASLMIGALLYANSLYLTIDSWFALNLVTGYLRSVGIAIVIAWLYFNQVGRLVNLLEVRSLKYIGVISYGIYMFQGLFLGTGPYRNPEQTWPPSQEIGFVLLLLAAPLSYHYFERPFLRLKESYSASKAVGANE